MGSACSGGQSVATADGGNDGSNRKTEEQAAPNDRERADLPADPGNQHNSQEPAKPGENGELSPTAADPPAPAQEDGNKIQVTAPDEDADAELKNIDGGPAQYKLVYLAGLRFRAEPIRLILRLAGVPYEEQLVSFSEWPTMKESAPMGALPLLYVNDRVICQTNAIARLLAKKYGLAGKTNLEAAKVDMFVDALTDVMNELVPLILEQDAGKKSDMWHQLKDDIVCPFLDLCIKLLADNGSGWFVGDKVTWADLAISEFLANLNEKIDSTLLNTYPALQAHINGVRALPRIEEYLLERPDAII